MNEVKTEVIFFKDDLGKNLYRKKTYYTIEIEQEVLAKDSKEADTLFTDGGGINHDEIKSSITDENKGVAISYVDANFSDSETTEYVGKVVYDEDDEFAEEDGNVIVDGYADEIVVKDTDVIAREESDIDVAMNLAIENEYGKIFE